MRLRDYYRGLPLRLTSALPPDDAARRINEALASPLQPFATGVLGRVSAGHLSLRYRPGLFAYRDMPILTGPITALGGGSLLTLCFRGRGVTRAAFFIGYAVMAAMVLAWIIAGEWHPGIGRGERALIIALSTTALFPLLIHVIAIRSGEVHLAKLAAFLEYTLDATQADERRA